MLQGLLSVSLWHQLQRIAPQVLQELDGLLKPRAESLVIKKSRMAYGITSEDLRISATLGDLPSLLNILEFLKSHARKYNNNLTRLLDCGCGYGGLTTFVANYLGIREVYGIDIDEKRLLVARSKGVKTWKVDLNFEKIPVPDEFFDIVTSFGVLEHLVYFDNFFIESLRILRKGGYLLIAMPNLGSYINRIALLGGFQPRDIEISRRTSAQGFLPVYNGSWIGHIHSATLRAIKQITSSYGFTIIKIKGSSPYGKGKLIRILDKIFSVSPSLSRRYIILSQKPSD